MPMQIINDPYRSLTSGYGTALGTGLEELAQQKLDQFTQRQQQSRASKGLEALGFNKDEAAHISQFDPATVAKIAQEKTRANQRQISTAPGLKSIVPGLSNEEADVIGKLPPGLQLEFYRNYLKNTPAQQEDNSVQEQPDYSGISEGAQGALSRVNKFINPGTKLSQQLPQETLNKPEVPVVQEKPIVANKPKTVAERTLEERQKKEQRALDKETRVEEHKNRVEADKETKKYYDNLLALDEAADASELRLNKMEDLINKKGGLPISSFYKVFKKLEEDVPAVHAAAAGAAVGGLVGLGAPGAIVGGAIGGLISPVATLLRSAQTFTSPNTEEFEKLSNDFVREAKSIFGSRITDQDLKTFMSLVPTLSQTDNGKLQIIKNMRAFMKANRVRAKYMKDIIKENKGHRPFDLPILVQERAKDELDKISQEFIAD